jgi:predicted PurR-regulated permease PerM
MGVATVAIIATLWALHWAEAVLVPLALAVVLAIALRPLVRRLEGWRIPAPVGAAFAVLSGVGLLFVGGSILADPVREWSARVPGTIQAAAARIEPLRRRFDRFAAALTPSDHTTTESAPGNRPADSTAAAQASSSAGPSAGTIVPIAGRIFGSSAKLLSGFVETILLLFFILAGGSRWRARLATSSGVESRAGALRIAREVSHVISRFVGMMLLINLAQGIVIAVAMAVIGMPAPIMWGVLTVVAELAPYVGAATMITLLLLVGLAGPGHGIQPFIAPAIYLVVATIQTNVVGPLVYGQGLKLNPVAILLALMLWWFLWGVPGAFLAVPILAAAKVVCDRVPALSRAAAFMAD